MTQLEQRAAEAWRLMLLHGMPAGIALDYLQELTDDRQKARESIVWQASLGLGRVRLVSMSDGDDPEPQHEAAVIAGLIYAGPTEAESRLRALKLYLSGCELAGQREFARRWFEWCWTAERAIDLCRQLEAAK